MIDLAAGDQPWNQPGAFNPNPPAPVREPRQKRKPRAEAAPKKERKARSQPLPDEQTTVMPPPKKLRKAKKEKAERAAPETIKVDLREYAEMRIAPAAKEFLKIHKIMSGVHGIARAKLLAELQKVFG